MFGTRSAFRAAQVARQTFHCGVLAEEKAPTREGITMHYALMAARATYRSDIRVMTSKIG